MDLAGPSGEELEAAFQEAADRVAGAATSGALPSDHQLPLYGLYKQATSGDCTVHRPSFFEIKARSKWVAWKNLEGLPREEAKLGYVAMVEEVLPQAASEGKAERAALGPVVSRLADAGPEGQAELGVLHASASEGDAAEAERLLAGGADVNARDAEGCTPLHWASDRGSLQVIDVLLKRGADVNARNADGQTPLHFAALCSQAQAVQRLLAAGADPGITSVNGETCADLATPEIRQALSATGG